MKKYLKLFTSILITIPMLHASLIQTSVTGNVTRNENNLPLAEANIVLTDISGVTFGTTTDENGNFNLNDIPAGNYKIMVSFIGFEDFTQQIIIEDGKTYTINAALSIQPITMAKLEIISDSDSKFKDLPGASTVLDIKTIKLLNPIGTQEMLEYVPGVNGFSDDGIGNSRISVGIRGINPRRSSRVLILEDGIPIQPALYVYPNMYYNPPSERIDRLEVIKGSGAIEFGPQTMGGIINYFTRRPRTDFGGVLKFNTGENGYGSLFAEVGGWGNDKLNPELQLLIKKGDGFRENNSFYQSNATLKLNYLKSDDENIYFKTNFNYENSNATYTGLTKWSFENDPKYNPKEDDNFKLFRSSFDIIHTKRINSNLTTSNTYYASYFDRRWWRENDVFVLASQKDDPNASAQPYYSINDLVRRGNGKDNFGILRTFYVLGAQKNFTLKKTAFGLPSEAKFGARLYFERFIDDKQTGEKTDSRDGIYFIPGATEDESPTIVGQSHHYETTALSAFYSEKIETSNFQFRPGVRFEIFEQERVDRLNGSTYQDKSIAVLLPGFGFTTQLFGLNLFGGVHRGFTPPSSGALKILNFGMGEQSSGLDLEAEKSWNKEIGLRGNLSIIDLEIAGFHIDIENLVAAGRGTAFRNLGKVNSMGVEVNTNFLLSEKISFLPNLHFSYAFMKTEVVDGKIISNVSGSVGSEVSIKGKELPYAPRHTLTAGFTGNYFNALSFRLDARYVSKVFTDFENINEEDKIGVTGPVPSYYFINISADYDINEKFRIFLFGKNITDEIYVGSRLHSNPGQKQANISSGIIPGARRQINLGLEYNF